MALIRLCTTLLVALLATSISAQQLIASNDTSDIPPYDSSPRFWVNGTGFDAFRIYPQGWLSHISQTNFLSLDLDGTLRYVDGSNANVLGSDDIVYMSCDPEDNVNGLGPSDVLRTVASAQRGNVVILYSTRATHCDASSLRSIYSSNSVVFSTLDSALAARVAGQLRNITSGMPGAVIAPDRESYSRPNNQQYSSSPNNGPGPTTAVAMIILYTITGIITMLFVIIIVTGAIRAHRHPERYGPQTGPGRPRRTRAKGIARAMLDTIPIVKFGAEKDEPPKKQTDIEMNNATDGTPESKDKSATAVEVSEESDKSTITAAAATTKPNNADGTDESGQLGCSICTEDFTQGEEVRVLPCNHKFHPECVDPWLLNVSGTCPLCRIDLRPKDELPAIPTDSEIATGRSGSSATAPDTQVAPVGSFPPPLGRDRGRRGSAAAGRRDTVVFANLRSVVSASREERIAALRRFRQQRRSTNGEEGAEQEEERRGLSTRLRERFRIRTRRQGEEEGEEGQTVREASVSASERRQRRFSSAPPLRQTWLT